MSESEVTLIVGVAGILATLIVSALSLYYTAKARNSSLRDALFDRQLDLAISSVHLQSRLRVFLTILSDPDSPFKEEARLDLGQCFKDFSENEEKAAAVLPVELWIEIKSLSKEMSNLIQFYDEHEEMEEAQLRSSVARMTKIALLTRATFGVDELTEQSISLFSSQKAYSRTAAIEVEHLAEIHDRVNKTDA